MRILNFGSRAKRENPVFSRVYRSVWLTGLLLFLVPIAAHAYPPAPHHEIYGLVRDQWGNPFTTQNARIILETENGTQVTGTVSPGLAPGVNYRVLIPMDAGLTPDRYRPTALEPLVPFRIRVRSGSTTWLPIQMQGNYVSLGDPAERTRIDLTLGVDSDGDGLPDAWKDMVIAMLGGGLTRADIRPDDDLDGDGMTNMQEYIAGTYPWDSQDRLWLHIHDVSDGTADLEFLAITGRTYTILESRDLREWEPARFQLPTLADPERLRFNYFAPEVRRLNVHVPVEADGGSDEGQVFYRLKVQ